MSSKYKFGKSHVPHFVSFVVVDWIDVSTRNEYKDFFVESQKYCIAEKGLILHAWILMTNHAHLIVTAKDNYRLSEIFRDVKKFTSKQILNAISENKKESRKEWLMHMFRRAGKFNSNNKDFQFWQQDNHPIQLSTSLMPSQRLDYLNENPVRAGIVRAPEEYLYSSGVDYYSTGKGLIEIEYLHS